MRAQRHAGVARLCDLLIRAARPRDIPGRERLHRERQVRNVDLGILLDQRLRGFGRGLEVPGVHRVQRVVRSVFVGLRIDVDRLAPVFERLGEIERVEIRDRQVVVAGRIRRVFLDQLLVGLDRLVGIPRDADVVAAERPQLFALGHAIGAAQRLVPVLLGFVAVSQAEQARPEARVGAAELGVVAQRFAIFLGRLRVALARRQVLRDRCRRAPPPATRR